jgi:hypothetical protein
VWLESTPGRLRALAVQNLDHLVVGRMARSDRAAAGFAQAMCALDAALASLRSGIESHLSLGEGKVYCAFESPARAAT